MATRGIVFSSLLFLLATAFLPAETNCQDFRIDTEVFYGQEKQPALETLTIFTGGTVYDFLLSQPREVAIFDSRNGRFVLLDEGRQVKCEVNAQDLLEFTATLEAEAAKRKEPLVVFAARPQFETSFEETMQNGQPVMRVKLAAKPMEYVAICQKPERREAVDIYRQFADWYARLNATWPGNQPPGPRLVLNQTLAERGLLPLEITRTIPSSNPLGKKSEVRTRHLVNWALAGQDQKRIDQAGDWQSKFRPISFNDYRKTK